jgi:hypothetical protein
MNKNEYADLHYLLAKLKYELSITMLECDVNSKYAKQLKRQIEEIDDIMKIFIVECE